MGHIRIKANECEENNSRLKETIYQWHNDDDMMAEFLWELTAAKETC